ncbi:uncharacterized protein LOC127859382 [Dreissena polymorpha]|uniref:Uncharacterized protein n=1 Tax=Dreissena polymorpha TaxID=45954 RepID=A0A9D3YT25_DREPO|nr:uncharacterized protein LOC127859382 [Dreissena polymorpha]KAH3704360.1 hypothetical protein DPMN_079416 [Dreissena polymorpha]
MFHKDAQDILKNKIDAVDRYRHEVLRFLIDLRDVGIQGREHIQEMYKKSRGVDGERKYQYIAIALVSLQEIMQEDHSIVEQFRKYVIELDEVNSSRTLLFQRVSVVMNSTVKSLSFHGERRVFDPDKRYLFEHIDSRVKNSSALVVTNKVHYCLDNNILHQMHLDYVKHFQTTEEMIILLYSHNIPCDIPFNECYLVLTKFVDNANEVICLGYDKAFTTTNEEKVIQHLRNNDKIKLFNPGEIMLELERIMQLAFAFPECSDDDEDDHAEIYLEASVRIPHRLHLCNKYLSRTCQRLSPKSQTINIKDTKKTFSTRFCSCVKESAK